MGGACCSAGKIEESRLRTYLGQKIAALHEEVDASPLSAMGSPKKDVNINEEEGEYDPLLSEFNVISESEVVIQASGWNFLDITQMPYKELRLVPPIGQAKVNGFINQGVNCYMNVIFQMLCNMPGIKEYFLINLQIKESSEQPNVEIEDNFINRVAELIQLYHSYNDFVLEPTWLFKEITNHNKTFNPIENQQDAHEFLIYMLERLSTNLNR